MVARAAVSEAARSGRSTLVAVSEEARGFACGGERRGLQCGAPRERGGLGGGAAEGVSVVASAAVSVAASAAVSVVASATEEARSGTLRGAISVVASAVLPDVGNFGVLIVGQTTHMVVRDLRSW